MKSVRRAGLRAHLRRVSSGDLRVYTWQVRTSELADLAVAQRAKLSERNSAHYLSLAPPQQELADERAPVSQCYPYRVAHEVASITS